MQTRSGNTISQQAAAVVTASAPATDIVAPEEPMLPTTQQVSTEKLCNMLIQSIVAKDDKLMLSVLSEQDDSKIKDIIARLPVNHVRKFVLGLRNILSTELSVNHLRWLQNLLALKYTVISSMADGRSILLPLISLLEDRSSPSYYNKMQGLKGKILLLKQLKEARRNDTADLTVRAPLETEQPTHMDVESETDTESEDELEENIPDTDEEEDRADDNEDDDGEELTDGDDDVEAQSDDET